MIMTHPEHGNVDVCFSDQVEAMEKQGWVPQSIQKKDVDKEELERLRSLWEATFGVKPHHAKKAKNLLKEIEEHGNGS